MPPHRQAVSAIGYFKKTAVMRHIIWTFILIFSTLTCFGQKIEPYFIDNLKTSKWKSLNNFNDSTILQLRELKLTRWNAANDSLKHYPMLWIYNDELKIKYYSNATITQTNNSIETKTDFDVINYTYSYNNDKGILAITLDNNDKTTLTYKTSIVSTGSFILLTRKNNDP
jgi:hypothetical protein